LARSPDAVGALDRRAQLALVPADADADEIVIVAARLARAARPRDVLNDQFGCFDASSGRLVVSIADANQPLSVSRQQFFRACRPRNAVST